MPKLRGRKSFGERNQVIIGIVGSAILVAMLLLSLTYQSLPFFDSGRSYSATFHESGTLDSGDQVIVAGTPVGTVSSVSLDHGLVLVRFTVTDDGVRLGRTTLARISTQTVLGKRALELTSHGGGTLAEGTRITRTIDPYDLNDALSQLTATSGAIDTASAARALETLTQTFRNTPASLRSTATSVAALSRTISSRDDAITSLFEASNHVTSVLVSRNVQITKLLGDGTQLLQIVNSRRELIGNLLVHVQHLAQQLEGLVADQKGILKPALKHLNDVLALLNRNKKNLDLILDRAGPFAASLGEAVSTGPFFQAYVQNLLNPGTLTGLGR